MEILCSEQCFHAALYEHPNVVLKRDYRRTSIRKMTRLRDGLCFEVDIRLAEKERESWRHSTLGTGEGKVDADAERGGVECHLDMCCKFL